MGPHRPGKEEKSGTRHRKGLRGRLMEKGNRRGNGMELGLPHLSRAHQVPHHAAP